MSDTPATLLADLAAALGLDAAGADDAQRCARSEADAYYHAGRAHALRHARRLVETTAQALGDDASYTDLLDAHRKARERFDAWPR